MFDSLESGHRIGGAAWHCHRGAGGGSPGVRGFPFGREGLGGGEADREFDGSSLFGSGMRLSTRVPTMSVHGDRGGGRLPGPGASGSGALARLRLRAAVGQAAQSVRRGSSRIRLSHAGFGPLWAADCGAGGLLGSKAVSPGCARASLRDEEFIYGHAYALHQLHPEEATRLLQDLDRVDWAY